LRNFFEIKWSIISENISAEEVNMVFDDKIGKYVDEYWNLKQVQGAAVTEM
jgi:hypothetical protein